MKIRKNSVVNRALRGGSYDRTKWLLRARFRDWRPPERQSWNFGFRFVIRDVK